MLENPRFQTLFERGHTKSPLVAIRRLVRGLHREYGVVQPPFDAYRLCELANIKVEPAKLIGCDARLLRDGNGWTAEVSTEISTERQFFSLCHEIGHTFFETSTGRYNPPITSCSVSTSAGHRTEEQLCNYAAAELLMPEKIFRPRIEGKPLSLATVWSVAREFRTSAQAVLARIIDLDLWEAVTASFRASEIRETEGCFYLSRKQASRSAFADLRQDIVILCLREMARSPRHLDRLGLWETYETGNQVEREFSIKPLGKSFLIQSFKSNYGAEPSVISVISRRR